MDRDEIIEALEHGDYRIEHDEYCGCSISWDIRGNELVCDTDGNECWEGYTLCVHGTDIAEYVRYEGGRVLLDWIKSEDIPAEVWDKMRLSDMVERGESGSCEMHDDARCEALVEWLMGCGYELDRDDGRGFANEYTMILREVSDEDYVAPTREEAEEWADQYLYAGDAATTAYNGFRLEEEE